MQRLANLPQPETVPFMTAGTLVGLRHIAAQDLPQISRLVFDVAAQERLTDLATLKAVFQRTGFWEAEAGSAAIVEIQSGRLLGTVQFYPSGPTLKGLELNYILHDVQDRGRGLATQAVTLFSDYLFATIPGLGRLQLIIGTWNVASWRLAERCGYLKEGLLRNTGVGFEAADSFIYSRLRKDWDAERQGAVSLGQFPSAA